MFKWIKSLFSSPQPAGPPVLIKRFDRSESTISKDEINPSEEGWLVDVGES